MSVRARSDWNCEWQYLTKCKMNDSLFIQSLNPRLNSFLIISTNILGNSSHTDSKEEIMIWWNFPESSWIRLFENLKPSNPQAMRNRTRNDKENNLFPHYLNGLRSCGFQVAREFDTKFNQYRFFLKHKSNRIKEMSSGIIMIVLFQVFILKNQNICKNHNNTEFLLRVCSRC